MLVKNWMSKNVITVDINESLIDAVKLLKHNDIGRLPVMKKGEMVGIVTDRDVKRASASDAVSLEIHELLYLLSKLKIEEIMTKDPITVPPDYTVEETADVLLENKISSTPVVNDQDQLRPLIDGIEHSIHIVIQVIFPDRNLNDLGIAKLGPGWKQLKGRGGQHKLISGLQKQAHHGVDGVRRSVGQGNIVRAQSIHFTDFSPQP